MEISSLMPVLFRNRVWRIVYLQLYTMRLEFFQVTSFPGANGNFLLYEGNVFRLTAKFVYNPGKRNA